MNRQKFIEFLNNPGELNEHNLAELDDLVTEHPYFQAGRALEAKGNRLLKTRVAGKKTASAAVYSTNRILLKKYLGGKGAVEKQPQKSVYVPKQAATESPTPMHIPIGQVPSEAREFEPSPGSSSIDQLIYSLKQDMKELEKSRAKYIEVTRKIEEEEAVENAVKRATGNVGSSTGKKSGGPASKTSRTSSPKKSTAKAKSDTAKKTTKSKTGTTKSGSKGTTSRTTKSSSASKATASKKAVTAKKTTTTKKTGTKTAGKKNTTKSTPGKSSSGTSRATKSSKKEDGEGENQRELIDQFIRKNPSFKPGNESKIQEDLSVESTTLPEDLGSEYLAEIFLGQGKKEQAIKIYNSLMLRFPEKKAYFAGRIKKIE